MSDFSRDTLMFVAMLFTGYYCIDVKDTDVSFDIVERGIYVGLWRHAVVELLEGTGTDPDT